MILAQAVRRVLRRDSEETGSPQRLAWAAFGAGFGFGRAVTGVAGFGAVGWVATTGHDDSSAVLRRDVLLPGRRTDGIDVGVVALAGSGIAAFVGCSAPPEDFAGFADRVAGIFADRGAGWVSAGEADAAGAGFAAFFFSGMGVWFVVERWLFGADVSVAAVFAGSPCLVAEAGAAVVGRLDVAGTFAVFAAFFVFVGVIWAAGAGAAMLGRLDVAGVAAAFAWALGSTAGVALGEVFAVFFAVFAGSRVLRGDADSAGAAVTGCVVGGVATVAGISGLGVAAFARLPVFAVRTSPPAPSPAREGEVRREVLPELLPELPELLELLPDVLLVSLAGSWRGDGGRLKPRLGALCAAKSSGAD